MDIKGDANLNNYMSARGNSVAIKATRQQAWKEEMMNRAAKIVYNDPNL